MSGATQESTGTRTHIHRVAVLLFLLSALPATAQQQLVIQRLGRTGDRETVYFRGMCNGSRIVFTDSSQLEIREDGMNLGALSLFSPDTAIRYPISTVLILTNYAYTAAFYPLLRKAANAYIRQMDGARDECAIMFQSNQGTQLVQAFTTDTSALLQTIAAFPALTGTTYPAVNCLTSAMSEIVAHAVNPMRSAVWIMSDNNGMLDNSIWDNGELGAMSLSSGIRLYTAQFSPDGFMGYENWDSGLPHDMRPLYDGTMRSRYDSTAFVSDVRSWAASAAKGFETSRIEFMRYPCDDGRTRTVALTSKAACGAPATAWTTYTTPKEPKVLFDILRVHLHGDTLRRPASGSFRLTIENTFQSTRRFGPFRFRLTYDTKLMSFVKLQAPPGSIMEGLPTFVRDSSGTLSVSVTSQCELRTRDLLCNIIFEPKNVYEPRNVEMTLSMDTLYGCFNPKTTIDTATVLPPLPDVGIALSIPKTLIVNRKTHAYDPEPFAAIVTATNNSENGVAGLSLRLRYDTTAFELVSAYPPLYEYLVPLSAHKSIVRNWTLRALPRMVAGSFLIGCDVLMNGAILATRDTLVSVPGLAPALSCRLLLPSVGIDTATGEYVPKVLPIRVIVTNVGDRPALNGMATITLPPALAFEVSAPSSPVTIPLKHPSLLPEQSDTVQWNTTTNPASPPPACAISVQALAENAAATQCEAVLQLPRSVAHLAMHVRTDIIGYDALTSDLSPMPFRTAVIVENTGIERADSVSVTIALPAGATLAGADAGRFTKLLAKGALQAGGMDSLHWFIAHAPTMRDSLLQFTYTLRSSNARGRVAQSQTLLPGLRPILAAHLAPPRFLVYLDTAFAPSKPFTVIVRCANDGRASADSVFATLALPPDVELINPADPLRKAVGSSVLPPRLPGDSDRTARWLVRYSGRRGQHAVLPFTALVEARNSMDGAPLRYPLGASTVVTDDTAYQALSWIWSLPDSSRLEGRTLAPNPIEVTVAVVNESEQYRRVNAMRLAVCNGLLDSIDATTPLYRALDLPLAPHDTLVSAWRVWLRAETWSHPAPFAAHALFSDGQDAVLRRSVETAAVPSRLEPSVHCSADSIVYDAASRTFRPSSFTLEADLRNGGGTRHLRAGFDYTMHLAVSGGTVSVQPVAEDSLREKSVFGLWPDDRAQFRWRHDVEGRPAPGDSAIATFTFRAVSDRGAVPLPAPLRLRILSPAQPVLALRERERAPQFALQQNAPNPVVDACVIRFSLPEAGRVRLALFDLLGRERMVLVDDMRNAGSHAVTFRRAGLPAGVYVYSLRAGSRVLSRTILLRD